MEREFSLFIVTFTTLLAIINPLEVLPVYLRLLSGKDDPTHRAVAWQACLYSLLLCFFFIFGTYILRLFGVPLSMVRIVGGIILMRIGFELFMPKKSDADLGLSGGNARDDQGSHNGDPFDHRNFDGDRGDDVRHLSLPGLCREAHAKDRTLGDRRG